MAHIEVARVPSGATADVFRVTVAEGGTSSEHRVTVEAPALDLAGRFPSLEAFVTASFRFLLEREPKESILGSFEIREIGRYFPEWEATLES